jgi:hypothetical protein
LTGSPFTPVRKRCHGSGKPWPTGSVPYR